MKKLFASVAALVAATWMVACGGTDPAANLSGEVGANIQAVLGNDFTGNFVRIHGVRSVPTDTKYPCLNEFEVCLGLDPVGATAAIKDLCPSDDTPEGTWAFTYVVFADAACTVPLANFGCIPTMQEWLHPGRNHNDVVCITRNAEKDFDLCVLDPVTGAGSEACPPCIPNPGADSLACNPS